MDQTEEENSKGTLPKQFAIKSKFNGNYLRYIHDNKVLRGFLQFSGNKVVSPYSKFEVEDSKTKKGCVHIRCSYNNKYWVRWSAGSKYIVAAATEPDEDTSKFSCTLFQPVYDYDNEAFRFKHVQLGHYASLRFASKERFNDCFFADTERFQYDESDVTTVVDWGSLFILPKHVAFRVHDGGYLSVHGSGIPYLQFAGLDGGNPSVGNEIFTTPDGFVSIKNDQLGKYWIRDTNWVHAKASEEDLDNPDTLFWPVRLGNSNGVALRNMGNHKFVKRLTLDGKENCLNAAVDTITEEAKMEFEELVIDRNIYDVNFRLLDARIYNETPVSMSNGEVENKNSEPQNSKLKLHYEEKRTSTWKSSITVKFGRKTSIETSIPLIASIGVELSAEVKLGHEWGGKTERTTQTEIEHEVMVPPYSKVKMKVLATKGFCDIPYSYTQRDVLTNGKVVVQHFDDGLYTGSNCYNYNFLAEQEPL